MIFDNRLEVEEYKWEQSLAAAEKQLEESVKWVKVVEKDRRHDLDYDHQLRVAKLKMDKNQWEFAYNERSLALIQSKLKIRWYYHVCLVSFIFNFIAFVYLVLPR